MVGCVPLESPQETIFVKWVRREPRSTQKVGKQKQKWVVGGETGACQMASISI